MYLISYDVTDDERRRKLVHLLKDYGGRVQYSVFELDLPEQKLQELRTDIKKFIKKKEDSVRYYFLCSACYARTVAVGELKKDEDVLIA